MNIFPKSMHSLAMQEAAAALAQINPGSKPRIIELSDLEKLPEPVSKYLIHCGVVGKEHGWAFSGRFTGKMKLKENTDWVPVKVVQYNVLGPSLTRIFFIKSKMFGFVPIVGRDKYEDGRGNMLIKIADLFKIVDQRGESMDRSELVTFLNDMAMFPAAMLNKKVTWEPADTRSARATLTDYDKSVSGIFYFDENFDIVNFETDDRTYDSGTGDVRKAKWWTPFRNHFDNCGIRTPGEGDAVWEFENGSKYHYADFKMEQIKYNSDVKIEK